MANGSDKIINRLLELTSDDDEEVRFRAFEAFEYFTPITGIIDKVKQGLKDKDELVRSTCIEHIGDWKDTDSTEELYF